MRCRILGLITTIVLAPTPAAADWLLSPFVGMRFGADSTLFFDFEQGAEKRKFVWGLSAGLLTDGIFGLEVDFGYIPGFFQGAPPEGEETEASSRAVTLTGNVLIVAPLGATGYGLRPYATGGLGLLHASSRALPPGDVLLIDFNTLALNIGGGAIGPVSPRSSIRFDVRHYRSIRTDQDEPVNAPGTQLTFWRATIGLTFRFPS